MHLFLKNVPERVILTIFLASAKFGYFPTILYSHFEKRTYRATDTSCQKCFFTVLASILNFHIKHESTFNLESHFWGRWVNALLAKYCSHVILAAIFNFMSKYNNAFLSEMVHDRAI